MIVEKIHVRSIEGMLLDLVGIKPVIWYWYSMWCLPQSLALSSPIQVLTTMLKIVKEPITRPVPIKASFHSQPKEVIYLPTLLHFSHSQLSPLVTNTAASYRTEEGT